MKVQQECLDPDDDEHLWTGNVVVEKRGEWEGCRDGAQAGFGERLKRSIVILILARFIRLCARCVLADD
jgi:hypothetical protein